MKNLLKLSALAAVLVASATYSSAATLAIASAAGTAASHTNGALEFVGYFATGSQQTGYPPSLTLTTNLGVSTGATQAIGTGGGVWAGPIAGSSWVSFAATQPGGLVAANGNYVYRTTFDTTALGPGPYSGAFAILADDTVSVFLNGTVVGNNVLTAQPVGADSHCSSGVPSCVDAAGTSFSNSSLIVFGVNTLYFVVQQTGSAAEGLDFAGVISTSAVPEPSTLLMLGTGLMGGAGALFRRMRK